MAKPQRNRVDRIENQIVEIVTEASTTSDQDIAMRVAAVGAVCRLPITSYDQIMEWEGMCVYCGFAVDKCKCYGG